MGRKTQTNKKQKFHIEIQKFFLKISLVYIYTRIKKEHQLLYNSMKFESSNIYFHEIIKVLIFLTQKITTKIDFKMFRETDGWCFVMCSLSIV